MLVKFISENRIQRARNPIYDNGKVYSNPTEETLRSLGYKDVIVESMPEVPEGKMAIPVYTDGVNIIQGWEIIDNEFEI